MLIETVLREQAQPMDEETGIARLIKKIACQKPLSGENLFMLAEQSSNLILDAAIFLPPEDEAMATQAHPVSLRRLLQLFRDIPRNERGHVLKESNITRITLTVDGTTAIETSKKLITESTHRGYYEFLINWLAIWHTIEQAQNSLFPHNTPGLILEISELIEQDSALANNLLVYLLLNHTATLPTNKLWANYDQHPQKRAGILLFVLQHHKQKQREKTAMPHSGIIAYLCACIDDIITKKTPLDQLPSILRNTFSLMQQTLHVSEETIQRWFAAIPWERLLKGVNGCDDIRSAINLLELIQAYSKRLLTPPRAFFETPKLLDNATLETSLVTLLRDAPHIGMDFQRIPPETLPNIAYRLLSTAQSQQSQYPDIISTLIEMIDCMRKELLTENMMDLALSTNAHVLQKILAQKPSLAAKALTRPGQLFNPKGKTDVRQLLENTMKKCDSPRQKHEQPNQSNLSLAIKNGDFRAFIQAVTENPELTRQANDPNNWLRYFVYHFQESAQRLDLSRFKIWKHLLEICPLQLEDISFIYASKEKLNALRPGLFTLLRNTAAGADRSHQPVWPAPGELKTQGRLPTIKDYLKAHKAIWKNRAAPIEPTAPMPAFMLEGPEGEEEEKRPEAAKPEARSERRFNFCTIS
jgi:hypothetical protein